MRLLHYRLRSIVKTTIIKNLKPRLLRYYAAILLIARRFDCFGEIRHANLLREAAFGRDRSHFLR
jgi:hypothetical protein